MIRVAPAARVPRRRAGDPLTVAVSVLIDIDADAGHDDAARLVRSLHVHGPAATIELVAVDRAPAPDADATWLTGWDAPALVLLMDPVTGWGGSRREALLHAGGGVVVIADTSVELTGDLCGALEDALRDPTIAVAGPFGLVTADLRDYAERSAGDVAAVQAYALAARHPDLLAIGGPRESFAFYRNADIDLSLRLRAATTPPRRAVAVGSAHCVRHAHRAWEATAPAERDTLSARNMKRVLDKFGRRTDLAVE